MTVILALTGKASDSSDFLYAIEEDLHVPRRNSERQIQESIRSEA